MKVPRSAPIYKAQGPATRLFLEELQNATRTQMEAAAHPEKDPRVPEVAEAKETALSALDADIAALRVRIAGCGILAGARSYLQGILDERVAQRADLLAELQ